MTTIASAFEGEQLVWRQVTDPGCEKFTVDFAYSLLGYDLHTGRLDMLLRYAAGGHCRPHRHVASTATLVLQGEQFLEETLPDGTKKRIHRKKGDYALAPADALPHDEWGGSAGGTVLLSMTAVNGVLFEYFEHDMSRSWSLSLQEYVSNWHDGLVHGAAPSTRGVIGT
jgi:hypothetical protein